MASEIPPVGNPGKWATAEGINRQISLAEKANGRQSPLHNMGADFVEFGNKYGINPGVVCAILQRESQMGCDGSVLPSQCNNFGGITQKGTAGYCTAASGIHGREWAKFANQRDGLEQTFKLLDSQLYRQTGGKLADIIQVYSPSFENNHDEIFMTFAAVGSNIGVEITRHTNIYKNGGTGSIPTGDTGNDWSIIPGWIGSVTTNMLPRIALFAIGLVIAVIAVRRLV
jgi:hypothetical protein